MIDACTERGDTVQFALTAALLALSVALGGGQGGLGDTFVQLLALGLLAWLFATPSPARGRLLGRPVWAWLPLAILAVPLLQMSPLLPIPRLGPERALWSLLPGLALYVSVLALSAGRQRRLLALVLVLASLSLVFGLMQVADGPGSALYFYSNTNSDAAVGLFANRNHLAALLVMATPLALATVAFAISERSRGKPVGPLPIAGAIGLAVMLIFGLALVHSRAGLVLGMFGLLLSAPMMLSLGGRRGVKRGFGLIVAASLLLTVQFALFGILQRLQADPLADDRWQFADITIAAARLNSPFGSGLGSFRQVFQTVDTKAPGARIVNHAHDDYLELWLEAGWPFVIVATLLIGLIMWAAVAAWRGFDGRETLWAKAASISLLLILLHSIVDYPLRTTSNQTVFALLLAVLMASRASVPAKTFRGPRPASHGFTQSPISKEPV